MPSWMPSFFFLPNKPQANYWQKEKFWRKGNKHFWQWVSVFVVVLFMLSLLLTSLDSVWATLCSEIVWMLPDFFSVGWISQFDFFFSIHCSPTCTRALLFPPHSFVCRVWCVYQKKNSAHFEPSQHEQFDQQPSSNQAISDGIYFARGFFIAPIEICLLLYWDRNTIINKRNFWTWSQNDKASGGRRKLQCMKSNLQPQLWFHIGIHVYAMLYTRVDI